MPNEFSGIIKEAGSTLTQSAENIFGAAVDQYSTDFLNLALGGGINGSGDDIPQIGYDYNVTNYAIDLLKYQPKNKYLFKVIFELTDNEAFSSLFGGSDGRNDFQYIIKAIDKPTVIYEYEPVNYYNFKSQVLKTIRHEPLNMVMLDDISNSFHNFFRNYYQHFVPASRSYNPQQSTEMLRKSGFNFSDSPDMAPDSAGRGLLPNNNEQILKSIRIFQYFGHGLSMNEFVFVNPRILDFNLDDVNYEEDTSQYCSVRFDYDVLVMNPAVSSSGEPVYPAGGSDMYIGSGSAFEPENPFVGMIRGAVGQVAGQAVQSAVGQVLGNIGSKHPILQSVTNKIGYGLGNTARNTVFSMSGGRPSVFSKSPIITDDYR